MSVGLPRKTPDFATTMFEGREKNFILIRISCSFSMVLQIKRSWRAMDAKDSSHIKGALNKNNTIPDFFFQKSWDFYTIRSVGMAMTACWFLPSSSTYYWRNVNISSMFYFSKSTLINTKHSGIWYTLGMKLFTKYLIKWICIGRISWKVWYWFLVYCRIRH